MTRCSPCCAGRSPRCWRSRRHESTSCASCGWPPARGPAGWVSSTIALGSGDVQVDGPLVRQVLRPGSGDILRSNTFDLNASRSGRRITRLVAEGMGNGHGVGFCQWGAVGRARAGQDYQRILAAYYPGTDLQRLY